MPSSKTNRPAAAQSARVHPKSNRQLAIKVPRKALAELDRYSLLMEIPRRQMLSHFRSQMQHLCLDFAQQYNNWAECWAHDRETARRVADKIFAAEPERRCIALTVEAEPYDKEVVFENPRNPPVTVDAPTMASPFESFTIRLPRDIAARVRYLAGWESKTPEGLIAEAMVCVSVAMLDSASEHAGRCEEKDIAKVHTLNAGTEVGRAHA